MGKPYHQMGFAPIKTTKNLGLSYKIDLGFGDCVGSEITKHCKSRY